MQTNDAKRAVLIALGIPAGAMPEMTRAWLVDLGALPDNGDTVTDLSWDFLTRVNSLSGSISDMWFIWELQGQLFLTDGTVIGATVLTGLKLQTRL